jgi:UTP pyrophosphatase
LVATGGLPTFTRKLLLCYFIFPSSLSSHLVYLAAVSSELTSKYLGGYPATLTMQVNTLLAAGKLGDILLKKYGAAHTVRTDKALYDYVMALKAEYLRSSEPLSKIVFDPRLNTLTHALGTHTTASRVQGGKLKAKREIRIATLFKEGPDAFLKMIAVHELAHIKEREHDKAFYQLCTHMEPNYHQYEFDLRAYLCLLETKSAEENGDESCIRAWSNSSKKTNEVSRT